MNKIDIDMYVPYKKEISFILNQGTDEQSIIIVTEFEASKPYGCWRGNVFKMRVWRYLGEKYNITEEDIKKLENKFFNIKEVVFGNHTTFGRVVNVDNSY